MRAPPEIPPKGQKTISSFFAPNPRPNAASSRRASSETATRDAASRTNDDDENAPPAAKRAKTRGADDREDDVEITDDARA